VISLNLAGETVIAERCFSRAKFEEAQVSEVLVASPKRITPKCAVFGICGGCSFQYLSSTDQIDAKGKWLKDAFQQQAKTEPKNYQDAQCLALREKAIQFLIRKF
jgi:23S rRNA (uracil1939-C5)-methyltransferase